MQAQRSLTARAPSLHPPLPCPLRFYAPWCGHCKNLAPEYARAAEVFAGSKASVLIAKFDADAHKETPTKFEVKGFPTLKWFPKGSLTPVDYEGERSAEALVDYVNAQTGLSKRLKVTPSAVAVLTPETFDTVAATPGAFKLLEFYAPWCGHCKQLAPTYEKLAQAFEGEPSVVIANIDADKHRSLGERFGVEGFPTIKYILPDATGKPEAAALAYDGPRDLEGMVKFVNEKAGTARTSSGGLAPTAGRVPSLDAAAMAFGKAPTPAGVADAKAAVAALTGKEATAGAAYIKAYEKILEKGTGYIAKEMARLDGMLASEEVTKCVWQHRAARKVGACAGRSTPTAHPLPPPPHTPSPPPSTGPRRWS